MAHALHALATAFRALYRKGSPKSTDNPQMLWAPIGLVQPCQNHMFLKQEDTLSRRLFLVKLPGLRGPVSDDSVAAMLSFERLCA